MDHLSAIRVFVAVADLGSFAAAARQLRLSPSVATRAIARLEDRLGLALLLVRTTRSVHVTEPGAAFLESCRAVLDDLDTAERRARGENAEPRGLLTVAAPVVFGRLHVLPVVTELLADYPALAIRLTLSDRIAHLVEDGLDVAIRIAHLDDSSLIAVRLGSVDKVVVASPAYLARRGTPAHPRDLAAHDIIAFDTVEADHRWHFPGGTDPVRVTPRLSLDNADTALIAADRGVGIVRALSYQAAPAIAAGRLIPLLQGFRAEPSPVSAVYPARRIAAANIAAFIHAARRYFRRDLTGAGIGPP